MDTCKKVIISGNYKDMEEKINFLTADDGSWCIDYEDEDKKVLIFAEDELDFQWSEKHISDYFLALYCKHKLNIKVKREEVTLYG